MEPAEYCSEKSAPAGSSLYYASLFYPASQKHLIHALFALQVELQDVIVDCKDISVATMKLKWWQDEISALFNHEARHPVTRQMLALGIPGQVEAQSIQAMINGIASQLHYHPHATLEELLQEKQQGAASSWQVMMQLLGCDDTAAINAVSAVASCYYMLLHVEQAIVRLKQDICPFPMDILQEAGITENEILQATSREPLIRLQQLTLDKLTPRLEKNLDALPRQLAGARFAAVLGSIELKRSRHIRKTGKLLYSGEAGITPIGKLWIAWRMSKRYR